MHQTKNNKEYFTHGQRHFKYEINIVIIKMHVSTFYFIFKNKNNTLFTFKRLSIKSQTKLNMKRN